MYEKKIGSGVQATPAEVVLIHTSLSGIRRHFYGSLRAKQFLDVKGVVYYQIDANRDFSIAARDSEIFDNLKNEGLLKMDPLESDGTILLPQIFVDGVNIGNDVSLQDLEEDNDFDWIINRKACGACLSDKEEDMEICPNCNQVFKTIVPPELVYSGGVQQIYRGNNTAVQEGILFEHPTNFVKNNNSGLNLTRNEKYEDYQDEEEYDNIAEEEYSEMDIKNE
ncbi:uncharacterized protein cubi_03108 [Cryptosporidium ubiquitum]|uniref:Uncharacterized protein n=1 Tax=Cryptosporidium ubiquitum TaxID=857276 RepID=A0A1J4MLD3_9CRYT|nr:uncharacterized protein cubi_03108 [Cryptosporidium ubiquitum]OII74998.1 hypothetical protein cubi_03108 [Cryptosporidium ubiquitum]